MQSINAINNLRISESEAYVSVLWEGMRITEKEARQTATSQEHRFLGRVFPLPFPPYFSKNTEYLNDNSKYDFHSFFILILIMCEC